MGLLAGLFGPRVPLIQSPRVGVLDLLGPPAAALLQEDTGFLGPLFGDITLSTTQPPKCNVLFVYCHIEAHGTIQGTTSGLREIVRDSQAAVVVIASPNPSDAYIAISRPAPYGKANLVMTLNRNGEAFTRFFNALFADMKRGVSMPKAWGHLAPQIPGRIHSNVPECIFACEAGQLAFG